MSDPSDVPSDAYDSDQYNDDDDSDFIVPPSKEKGKAKSHSIEHESLSAVRVQQIIDEESANVASIIGLPPVIATVLLQHFRWNKDRLIEQYLDSPAVTLQAVGEPESAYSSSPNSPPPRPNKRARIMTPADIECPICCGLYSADDVFRLRCGHQFCHECWGAYATAKIYEEGQCQFTCMQDGCPTIIDEPSVTLLVDAPTFARYRELILQSYVSATPTLRFCPHPECSESVICTDMGGGSVVPTVWCAAGHAFCFGCGFDSDHRPLVCPLVARWLKDSREDSGTSQWIKAHTRTCPNCQNNIEKNGGCNRILCRQCQFQFCWLCLKSWDTHGYDNAVCNTWKEPEPDQDTTVARAKLDKWLFYFDRFNNHELSARLDRELCERTAEKMVDVQKTSQMSWIEAKFMQYATDELTACRLTLKWSYAMAYFLEKGNHKEMFEDIQADLEKAVEQLSQLLEEPVESETVKSLRQRMMDKTVYVRGRHEILLQDTADGLAEGRWEWNVELN